MIESSRSIREFVRQKWFYDFVPSDLDLWPSNAVFLHHSFIHLCEEQPLHKICTFYIVLILSETKDVWQTDRQTNVKNYVFPFRWCSVVDDMPRIGRGLVWFVLAWGKLIHFSQRCARKLFSFSFSVLCENLYHYFIVTLLSISTPSFCMLFSSALITLHVCFTSSFV